MSPTIETAPTRGLVLTIKARLYIGFCILIGFVGVIAAIAVLGVSSLGQKVTVSSDTLRAMEIERSVLEMRQAVQVFLFGGDPAAAAEVRRVSRQLTGVLEAPESRGDPALVRIAAALDGYGRSFERLVALSETRRKLTSEQLDPLTDGAIKHLNAILKKAWSDADVDVSAQAGATQSALLLAHIDSLRFLATPTPQLRDQTRKGLDGFAEQARALVDKIYSAKLKAPAQEVVKLATSHADAFGQTATAVLEADQLVRTALEPQGREVAQLADQHKKAQLQTLLDAQAEIKRDIERNVSVTLIYSLIAVTVGLLVAWIVGRGIARPLKVMTGLMRRLAGGDRSIEVSSLDRGDEVGDIARAVQVFKDTAIEMEQLREAQERQEQQAEDDKRRTMAELAEHFEDTVKHVVAAVSSASRQLQGSAEAMTTTADQTNHLAIAVATAAERASVNVQTVAAATEELSCSIEEVSRQVADSTKIAALAVEEANRTNVTIAGLSDAAHKIGEVVGLINNIASQTNLLALNATIEAARAGEAGKGFAVVASEVKNLANQTAKATDDIQSQVGQMQSVTEIAVAAIKEITGTIRRMNDITTTIESAVEKQTAATQEIAHNVQQASNGTREVSKNIDGVTRAANETGKGAAETLSAANDLNRLSGTLSVEVDQFVSRIRSA